VILRANLDGVNSKLVSLEKVCLATINSKQAEQVVQALHEKHSEQVLALQLQLQQLKQQLEQAVISFPYPYPVAPF
jgi:multidrug resistance efflux pump